MSQIDVELASVIDINILGLLQEALGEALESVIINYLTNSQELLLDMKEAVHTRDLPKQQRIAHTLRGASLTIGAVNLANLCSQIEGNNLVEPNDVAQISTELQTEYDHLTIALKKSFNITSL